MLVAGDTQQARAAILSCARNMPTTTLSAEDYVFKADPTQRKQIQSYFESESYKRSLRREQWKLPVFVFDHHGHTLTFLKQIFH